MGKLLVGLAATLLIVWSISHFFWGNMSNVVFSNQYCTITGTQICFGLVGLVIYRVIKGK